MGNDYYADRLPPADDLVKLPVDVVGMHLLCYFATKTSEDPIRANWTNPSFLTGAFGTQ